MNDFISILDYDNIELRVEELFDIFDIEASEEDKKEFIFNINN